MHNNVKENINMMDMEHLKRNCNSKIEKYNTWNLRIGLVAVLDIAKEMLSKSKNKSTSVI